jgi:glycosyltransferase involved in cell wall biosynthesis
MRILIVCPDSPYPPRDGGSLRIVNLARSLAQHAPVMLLTYVVSPGEATALAELEQIYGIQARGVQRPSRRNKLTRAWHKLRYYYGPYLFTSLPGPVRFNMRPVMVQALQAALQDFAPDAIIWEYWFMSGFAELARAVRPHAVQVLDAHDLEWARIQRTLTATGDRAQCWQRYTEPRIKHYALDRYRSVDRVIFLSHADADLAQRDLPEPDRLSVVPMGLRLDEYPAPIASPQPGRVLFFGSFRHQPNVDALRYLLQDIFPRIQAERPQITLDIMGAYIPDWVSQLAVQNQHIRILGFQPDIRPVLAEAAVVIAPLRFGSGVKIKILEAMAFGKTVVTTSIGAEGIEAEAGRDFIVVENAQSLASETIRLLANPALCESIGQRARQFIWTHHNAGEIAQDFLARLNEFSASREPVQ